MTRAGGPTREQAAGCGPDEGGVGPDAWSGTDGAHMRTTGWGHSNGDY
jgi:hypothetical protein